MIFNNFAASKQKAHEIMRLSGTMDQGKPNIGDMTTLNVEISII